MSFSSSTPIGGREYYSDITPVPVKAQNVVHQMKPKTRAILVVGVVRGLTYIGQDGSEVLLGNVLSGNSAIFPANGSIKSVHLSGIPANKIFELS